MTLHREDAYCPACPDPETAFRIEDVGMKFDQDGFQDGAMTIKATRLVWEPVMLEHLRAESDDAHRRVYEQCVAALAAAGQTVEESARGSAQAVVDGIRSSMERTLRRSTEPAPLLVDEPFPSAFKVNDLAVAPEMTAWLNRERPAR